MAKFYSYEKVVDTVLSPERLYAFNRLANARSGKVLSVVATPEDQCYTHTDWWIGTSINLGRDFYKSLWDLDTKISISDIRDTYKHIGYTYVGVFYHELGHVLFTDMDFMFNLLRKYSDNFRYFAKQVSNILEDVTIEAKVFDKEQGAIKNYIPLVVIVTTFVSMFILDVLQKKLKWKWLASFDLGLSMLIGMTVAVIIG